MPNLEAVVHKWRLGTCCEAHHSCDLARTIREALGDGLGLEERRTLIGRAFSKELHFERHGDLLLRTLEALCHHSGGRQVFSNLQMRMHFTEDQ